MIAAILLERNLQNVANYLIVSLAVADLMVACLVMPLGAVYEVSFVCYFPFFLFFFFCARFCRPLLPYSGPESTAPFAFCEATEIFLEESRTKRKITPTVIRVERPTRKT